MLYSEAIWYENKKSTMERFLRDSFDELNQLQKEGLVIKGVRYKIRVLLVTVDMVMRAPLLGMTQFNEAFGCGFCLTKEKSIPKGRGGVRIYPEPFVADAAPPAFRTTEQHMRNLDEVMSKGKPVHGILESTGKQNLTQLI